MLGRRTWRRASPTHFRRWSADYARIGAVVAVFFGTYRPHGPNLALHTPAPTPFRRCGAY